MEATWQKDINIRELKHACDEPTKEEADRGYEDYLQSKAEEEVQSDNPSAAMVVVIDKTPDEENSVDKTGSTTESLAEFTDWIMVRSER